ncbi:MAG: hypothetical protein ACREFQ_17990, partial [Stellaceae bacterium]
MNEAAFETGSRARVGPHSMARRRVVFVAEQFAPPVIDGSTYVYKNWIDFLAPRHDLYGIFFTSRFADSTAAERYLNAHCKAHLILPGQPDARGWKVLRTLARMATGTLFAPWWIEELGRHDIYRAIMQFLDRHEPQIFLISKLAS